jgi:carbonic anhydrase
MLMSDRGAGFSRRDVLRLTALAGGLVLARRPAAHAPGPSGAGAAADEVLRRLREGNERFVKGAPVSPGRRPEDFRPLAEGQRPLAVIVGCADSRVPPEILFDQGVGDLFVIRVAGNVIGGAGVFVKGSIEYGLVELGISLVMVLGHSACGAVKAAIQHLDNRDALPGSLGPLVHSIRPAVLKAKSRSGDLLDNAIRANVEIGVGQLLSLQPIVAPAVKRGTAKVVGAFYDLSTGSVSLIG